jgi:crotonobetainyl-CoA:carnitine CoA-transferase CaiB-like acyl-CoA transferase
MTERTGPLADLRVIDLTQALAGPFCTMLLADLGADVIKVEPPQGDMTRVMGPQPKDRTTCDYGGYFASINRNKRSIVLDLKTEEGRAKLLALVRGVDVLMENSRVGVMDRLGLGWERLHRENPRLVYGAVRGFGDPRTGESPYAGWPAFDIVAQCMGGLVGITGPSGSRGFRSGPSAGDIYPGTLAALGAVSAVHAARRTGEGQFFDVSMYDAVLALSETLVHNYSYEGKIGVPVGNGHPSLCPFDVFETRDGAVAIAAPTDHHWAKLCAGISRPELASDPRLRSNVDRVANAEVVRGAIAEWAAQRGKAEVLDALAGEVPVGPVNTAKDIFDDPHPHIRGMLVDVELPGDNPTVTLTGCPIKLTATPSGIYRRPPRLGEHTEEVLSEAGIV